MIFNKILFKFVYSLQLQGRHDELHEQYTQAQEQFREVGVASGRGLSV